MLEWIKKLVIEFFVGIVLCLLDYFFLDGGNRTLVVIIFAICPFGTVVNRKRLLSKGFRFDKSGIGTALADKIILNSKRERSYVASIHIIIYVLFITNKTITLPISSCSKRTLYLRPSFPS